MRNARCASGSTSAICSMSSITSAPNSPCTVLAISTATSVCRRRMSFISRWKVRDSRCVSDGACSSCREIRTLSFSAVIATDPVTTACTRSSAAISGRSLSVVAYRSTDVRDTTRRLVRRLSCVMISSWSWRAKKSLSSAKSASGSTATAVIGAFGSRFAKDATPGAGASTPVPPSGAVNALMPNQRTPSAPETAVTPTSASCGTTVPLPCRTNAPVRVRPSVVRS